MNLLFYDYQVRMILNKIEERVIEMYKTSTSFEGDVHTDLMKIENRIEELRKEKEEAYYKHNFFV